MACRHWQLSSSWVGLAPARKAPSAATEHSTQSLRFEQELAVGAYRPVSAGSSRGPKTNDRIRAAVPKDIYLPRAARL